MKLYIKPGACSQAVHIALHEAGLACEIEAVDLQTKRTASGAGFRAISPLGYVPALVLDSGEVLTEGPAILQYIADLVPAAGLAPANGTIERYRLQAWLNFIATELHRSFGALFNPKAGNEWRVLTVDRLHERLAYIDRHLASQPWLMGEHYGVADSYLFVILNWCNAVKLYMAQFPRVQAYQARIAERPAVQAALQAETAHA